MTTKTTSDGDGGGGSIAPDFYFWLGEDAELIPVTEEEFDKFIQKRRAEEKDFREVSGE